MKYSIANSPDNIYSKNLKIDFEPKNEVLITFLISLDLSKLEELLKNLSISKSYYQIHQSVKPYSDLDWEDLEELKEVGGINEDEVAIYHEVLGDLIIKESPFCQIILDYTKKHLNVYENDNSLGQNWYKNTLESYNTLSAKWLYQKVELMNTKEIEHIKVRVKPSLKDEFIEPKESLLKLPEEFACGINHVIEFHCINCLIPISFSFNDKKLFEFIRRADKGHFQNYYQVLLTVGKIFELMPNFKKDEGGDDYVNSFSFTGKYKSVADIAAFNCPNCKGHYITSFAYYEGENEKRAEPDIMYIDKLLRVSESFDELRGMYL